MKNRKLNRRKDIVAKPTSLFAIIKTLVCPPLLVATLMSATARAESNDSQGLTKEQTLAALIPVISNNRVRTVHLDGICLYSETSYRSSQRYCFTTSMPTLPESWNNQISSISVSSSYHAIIFVDENYGGASSLIKTDAPLMDSFDNLVSSIQVIIKDEDGDGISYDIDECPETPSGAIANSVGCSPDQIDTDGDGVADIDDAFPLDDSEWLDSDSDGLGDNADPFPNDPSNYRKTYVHKKIRHDFVGDSSSDWFGFSVDAHGDVNNDGINDFVVGAPQHVSGGIGGYVKVFSGADGKLIHALSGSTNGQDFGYSVAIVDDLNEDGFDDIFVGAPNRRCGFEDNDDAGNAYLYSGLNGSLIYSFSGDEVNDCFGYSIAAIEDIDSDGVDDLLIGSDQDYVKVFSGADRALIHRLEASLSGEAIGHSISSAGDVNGDGIADIISGNGEYNYAEVFSGRNGSSLHTIQSALNDQTGYQVGALGDANQDGYDDFVVSRIWHNVPMIKTGLVSVYSGADGTEIWSVTGPGGFQSLGAAIDRADINEDGFPDLVVGTKGTIVDGRVEVLDGLTGNLIADNRLGANADGFGSALSSIGDLNGDGVSDLVVGAHLHGLPGGGRHGRVFVLESQIDSDSDGIPDEIDSSPYDPNAD